MSKISVVGSINVDLAVRTGRRPNNGETVIGNDFKIIPGGKGANQAVAIARLSGNVEMFGCIGNDRYGEMMSESLKKDGVFLGSVKTVSEVTTGVAVITVAENDNSIIIVPGANGYTNRDYIDSVKDKLLTSDLVLLQNEIPFDAVDYIIRLCHANAIPVILNPAPAAPLARELIDMVQYIVPNEHEVAPVFQTSEDMNSLMFRYPNKLIVTLGKNGVAYCDGKSVINVPAIEAKRVDTTGAGDTFLGAFAKSISDGADIYEAIVFSQYASGLSIEKFGAQAGMPSMQDVMKRRSEITE
jgi:ribokinase